MWPFSAEKSEAAPVAPPIDREAVALERVRQIKGELDALNGEMLAFKSRHSLRTDSFGRILQIICPLTERAVIETAWRELLRRRDRLMEAWPAALSELNEIRRTEK